MTESWLVWMVVVFGTIVLILSIAVATALVRVRSIAKLLALYVLHSAMESASPCAWELVGRAMEARILDNKDYHPSKGGVK